MYQTTGLQHLKRLLNRESMSWTKQKFTNENMLQFQNWFLCVSVKEYIKEQRNKHSFFLQNCIS